MSIEELNKQTTVNIQGKANLIWAIADKLVGTYKPHEYGNVIVVIEKFDTPGDRRNTRRQTNGLENRQKDPEPGKKTWKQAKRPGNLFVYGFKNSF